MISKKIWKQGFEGFHIYDCAVRNRQAFSFVLLQHVKDNDNSEPAKRLVNLFTDGVPELGADDYDGFDTPLLAVASHPVEQAIMVGLRGGVAALGGGIRGMEQAIPTGKPTSPLRATARALRTIDGYVYAVGGWRSVCRRVGSGKWESIADRETLPEPKGTISGLNEDGFNAIDGFSATDIYCAGGRGDIWHYDGRRWEQCASPTNMLIESICCAGDGLVYIGMQSDSVMRGRGNVWEIIHIGSMSLSFKDMVWYGGKIWCTSDYGIWTIEDGKLVEPDLPAEVRSRAGNLAVGDGVMLLAGMYGAAILDGVKWTQLIPGYR